MIYLLISVYSIAYYIWMVGHVFVGYSLGSLTSAPEISATATKINSSYIENWQITQIV